MTYKLRTNLWLYVFITLGTRSTLRGNVALNCDITATLCNITWNWHCLINTKGTTDSFHYSVSVFCSEVITLSDIRGHDEHVCLEFHVISSISCNELSYMYYI